MRLTTELKQAMKKDGLEHATNMQKDEPIFFFAIRKTPCGP